ncbi:hypothetical protein [Streptomyces sp. NPDC002599]|uniref:hypothetical protein n=1 Tax=Streptomyces sp. NPDC002599 TaxID=3154421 RepID=UPI0033296B34
MCRQGDKVAAYIDTDTDGYAQCTGRAKPVSADTDSLVVGKGQVTAEVPRGRCKPLSRQTLTVRSKDVLIWKSGDSTTELYRSSDGRKAVPDEYVGVWVPAIEGNRDKGMLRITRGPVGGRLVQIWDTGAAEDGSENRDNTFIVGAVSPVLALGPAMYAADAGALEARWIRTPWGSLPNYQSRTDSTPEMRSAWASSVPPPWSVSHSFMM